MSGHQQDHVQPGHIAQEESDLVAVMGSNGADVFPILLKPNLIKDIVKRRSGIHIVAVEIILHLVFHIE